MNFETAFELEEDFTLKPFWEILFVTGEKDGAYTQLREGKGKNRFKQHPQNHVPTSFTGITHATNGVITCKFRKNSYLQLQM
ncbi:Hypothetical predicted protein [Octopus vulgaris]|uniref:Uncharacterized protein n=1 Tax=Octopus vulgaris TaxID=6645 RepID=A0AA36FH46_OCTVU|nr:Hypothetical predicted protein [Octopus vulgaris]